MKFYGQTYWYPTPDNGLQEIGVTRDLGDCWIVAWFRGSVVTRVNTPNLAPWPDPCLLQARLDGWTRRRKLQACSISSR